MFQAELRFSEDQPRDEHGRWTGSGAQDSPFPTYEEVKAYDAEKQKERETARKINELTKQKLELTREMLSLESKITQATTDADRAEAITAHERVSSAIRDINQQIANAWNANGPTLDQKLAALERVKQEAINQGVSETWVAGHVVVNFDKPPEFTIGTQTRQYAGAADLHNGVVTLYPKAFGSGAFDAETGTYPAFERQMPGVLAHEIEHGRFQSVLKGYDAENAALSAIMHSTPETWDKIVGGNGYGIRDAYKDQFPLTTALQPFLEEYRDEMEKSDGVTDYSKMYWDALAKGELDKRQDWSINLNASRLAYHETLAEIARVKYEGKEEWSGSTYKKANGFTAIKSDKPSRDWQKLYQLVNKFAKQEKFGK